VYIISDKNVAIIFSPLLIDSSDKYKLVKNLNLSIAIEQKILQCSLWITVLNLGVVIDKLFVLKT
jgi:hypothetical protein